MFNFQNRILTNIKIFTGPTGVTESLIINITNKYDLIPQAVVDLFF